MKVHHNIPLSTLVYYQIGGIAKIVLEIASIEDVFEAIAFIKENHITETRVMGLGANLLLPDEEFDGAVLWMHGINNSFEITDNQNVKVFAGETMDSLLQFALNHSLLGLQWAGGLPSSVGGAVRGNAGAFGSEIKESVISVDVLDMTSSEKGILTFSRYDSQFSYRHSYFKEHAELLILNITFGLTQETKEEVEKAKAVYEANIAYRHTNHPMEYPSCGSVFMNITKKDEVEKILSVWSDVRELSERKWHNKVSMGYIIDRLGFTGKRIGNAQVSEKHSNYIVNLGNAKAQDVSSLISEIKNSFYKAFGFYPTPEVMLLSS